MIVFIAGMPRSGSTYTFSVVREALQKTGDVYLQPDANLVDACSRAETEPHLLLKGHGADPLLIKLVQLGAIPCICSVRRMEDASASLIELFGFSVDQTIAWMREWTAMYRAVASACLTIAYPEIDTNPLAAVEQILRYLQQPIDAATLHSIQALYGKSVVKNATGDPPRDAPFVEDCGFSWFDRRTFFHRRHVSSLESRMAENRLPAAVLETIRLALKDESAFINSVLSVSPR